MKKIIIVMIIKITMMIIMMIITIKITVIVMMVIIILVYIMQILHDFQKQKFAHYLLPRGRGYDLEI